VVDTKPFFSSPEASRPQQLVRPYQRKELFHVSSLIRTIALTSEKAIFKEVSEHSSPLFVAGVSRVWCLFVFSRQNHQIADDSKFICLRFDVLFGLVTSPLSPSCCCYV
jgi:hypothetical protein